MGVQALHLAVPGNLRSHRNLADHGQGRQLFQEERVGQDGRGPASTQETRDAMRYGGPSSAKCWAWGQGRGDRERLGSVDSTRGQTGASDHGWGFLAGWRGLDGLGGGVVQPVLALEWFLGDSAPAKEAANFEDKSGAWRLSPVAKLSLYHLQAVCHWVISKPLWVFVSRH